MKRIFLIVLDSFGIGQMPDAKSFESAYLEYVDKFLKEFMA